MKLETIPPAQERVLARLREICLAFPGASEEVKWGHPNWVVGGKIFASWGAYGDRFSFGSKQTLAEQAMLVEDPRFFVSPYVGKHGWVSMYTDTRVAWRLVEQLVDQSYRLVAPKRMLAALDDRAAPSGRDRGRRARARR